MNVNKMLSQYLKNLYQHSMTNAYTLAGDEIKSALAAGGSCLDCGANQGGWYERLNREIGLGDDRYNGIEWSPDLVATAQGKGINVIQGDLNQPLPFADGSFQCVFALSVLEHLLYGCRFLQECHRTLDSGGRLVLLTPNISTYFTAILILAGRMPSSGPHPDSQNLLGAEEVFKVSSEQLVSDADADCPVHRHLVVFSYRVLKRYLMMLGFSEVQGYGFGLYPLPVFMQGIAGRLDPWHCHQMVFVATR